MKAETAAVAVTIGGESVGDGDEWWCRKHPVARSGGGVCPHCLRDRLLRLCPNCAHVRPCPCTCASPSSSSSASGDAVDRVHTLIEREHRIARSRSVAASSSVADASSATAASGGVGGRRKARVWRWPPFWKAAARDGAVLEDDEEGLGLARWRRRGGGGTSRARSRHSGTGDRRLACRSEGKIGRHRHSPEKRWRLLLLSCFR
ncbi:hypothetical protein GUJ93_ZPchr0002g26394 [Zizania palustris]|uniref:Uncharacterized protein n=1 Tax=Zizania palustris TaxID=103762 RepID=A0A8J5RSG7_ZIZPA|nr:hypothetical protein GUJ93_ZPchr0002g26394 [Zizania palustris]